MKITVEFDSMDDFEAFRVSGRAKRTKKEEAADEAPVVTPAFNQVATGALNVPAPLQPPAEAPAFNPPGLAPPAPFAALASAFPAAAAAPAVDPAVAALVGKITAKRDSAFSSGASSADGALGWFREQCGPEAAQATMAQIDQVFLPKMPPDRLAQLAKWMGITA